MSITKLVVFMVVIVAISVPAESGLVTITEWIYQAFAFSNVQSNIGGQGQCNNHMVQSTFVLGSGNNNSLNTLVNNSIWNCIVNNATHRGGISYYSTTQGNGDKTNKDSSTNPSTDLNIQESTIQGNHSFNNQQYRSQFNCVLCS